MENPVRLASKLLKESGLEVDDSLVDEYALFLETAVIHGPPLTAEGRIIAALVVKLGGHVSISANEVSKVSGLVIQPVGDALDITAA